MVYLFILKILHSDAVKNKRVPYFGKQASSLSWLMMFYLQSTVFHETSMIVHSCARKIRIHHDRCDRWKPFSFFGDEWFSCFCKKVMICMTKERSSAKVYSGLHTVSLRAGQKVIQESDELLVIGYILFKAVASSEQITMSTVLRESTEFFMIHNVLVESRRLLLKK